MKTEESGRIGSTMAIYNSKQKGSSLKISYVKGYMNTMKRCRLSALRRWVSGCLRKEARHYARVPGIVVRTSFRKDDIMMTKPRHGRDVCRCGNRQLGRTMTSRRRSPVARVHDVERERVGKAREKRVSAAEGQKKIGVLFPQGKLLFSWMASVMHQHPPRVQASLDSKIGIMVKGK